MDGFDRRERRRRYQRQQQLKKYGILVGIFLGIILAIGGVSFLGVKLFQRLTAQEGHKTQSKIEERPEKEPQDSEVNVAKDTAKGVLVMIDPGHGERVPGCVIDDVMEKDITLAVSLKLRDVLQAAGATVKMTREDDSFYPRLKERGKMANDAHADYFISIHCNSYTEDSSIRGFESYFYGEDGKKLSKAMVKAAKAAGIPAPDSKYGNFQVLRDTKMPSVLVEIGYMTNPEELQDMCDEDYQQKLAEAIARGLVMNLRGSYEKRKSN